MDTLTYLAVLEPNDDGSYSVFFPDFDGCISYGDDIVHAQKMAREALELHIYGMQEDEISLPNPSYKGLKTSENDIVVPITIYPELAKAEIDNYKVKTNCTLPQWLKKRAEKEHINFSQELQNALKVRLGING